MGKAGGVLIWVGINLVMLQEAPMRPASKSEAAHANHGHPTGECSGDIFLSLDFPPSGNRLIFSNGGWENLKALNYIYSISKELIKKSKTCGPHPMLGATVDTNISSI